MLKLTLILTFGGIAITYQTYWIQLQTIHKKA